MITFKSLSSLKNSYCLIESRDTLLIAYSQVLIFLSGQNHPQGHASAIQAPTLSSQNTGKVPKPSWRTGFHSKFTKNLGRFFRLIHIMKIVKPHKEGQNKIIRKDAATIFQDIVGTYCIFWRNMSQARLGVVIAINKFWKQPCDCVIGKSQVVRINIGVFPRDWASQKNGSLRKIGKTDQFLAVSSYNLKNRHRSWWWEKLIPPVRQLSLRSPHQKI